MVLKVLGTSNAGNAEINGALHIRIKSISRDVRVVKLKCYLAACGSTIRKKSVNNKIRRQIALMILQDAKNAKYLASSVVETKSDSFSDEHKVKTKKPEVYNI